MFSVIIPTCNRNYLLEKCLFQLSEIIQTSDIDCEVIVSDDSNVHSAQSLVHEKFPWVRWVKGPERGPASNRNMGASFATKKWLIFTDDDCMPDDGWLYAYGRAIINHPNVLAFEGAILPDDWSLLNDEFAECPVNDKGGCFWSANIMIEKGLFKSLNGFDERFRLAAQEDQDIYYRILKKEKVVFVKDAQVFHAVRIAGWKSKLSGWNNGLLSWLLLRHNQSYTMVENLRQGIKTNVFGAYASLKKRHFKKMLLHGLSLFHTFIFTIALHNKSKHL